MLSNDDIFEHVPLPDLDNYFRLLKITKGGFGQSVILELSQWPIEHAPAYIAVSYAWGDAHELSTLTINSKPAIVRRNCEYVLQQHSATSPIACHYLWVDAICIDQQNITERSHQVALMGRIYSKAVRVHACTGPHADDSHTIFTDMNSARLLLSRIYRLNAAQINPPLKYALQTMCFLATGERTRKTIVHAYLAFLRRPYFSRVWILQ